MNYMINDLVRVAKRDNNNIRPYLYVNPLQGKHVPTNPLETLKMCRCLADKINRKYSNEKIYIIGFAETATGIAAAIASYVNNAIYFQCTTREMNKEKEYIFFTESHSHATDQLLRLEALESIIKKVDRIIFIDDEVTTGNTICKLIDIINKNYKGISLEYSIASVLNSMSSERIENLKMKKIDCLSILSIPYEYKKDMVFQISNESNNHDFSYSKTIINCNSIDIYCNKNPRNGVAVGEYIDEVDTFAESVIQLLNDEYSNSILVMGTEEFMYSTFIVGKKILDNKLSKNVSIHSTTRSPIIACEMDNYPLTHRYQIRSLYDENRLTYLYNLNKYEKVIIMTDSQGNHKGINDLLSALKSVGNNDISFVRCIYDKKQCEKQF